MINTRRIMSTVSALMIATSVLTISGMATTYDGGCSSLESDNLNAFHCNTKVCGGSSSFGGTHTVTYDELLGAIRNNKDSWIIVGG